MKKSHFRYPEPALLLALALFLRAAAPEAWL